ncbi:MAG: LuxR C-terminal-related transcriptional regulator [Thermoanaerobaculia bacterium]
MKRAGPTAVEQRNTGWVADEDREWRDFSKGIKLLVQQLVDALDGHGPSPGGKLEDKVMLDVEVSGVRCLLVRRPRDAVHPEGALSPREREIARMVARGYPNKVIARVLDISSWTVSTHLRRIFAKLGVSSRAAMVAQLLEEGRLPPDVTKR